MVVCVVHLVVVSRHGGPHVLVFCRVVQEMLCRPGAFLAPAPTAFAAATTSSVAAAAAREAAAFAVAAPAVAGPELAEEPVAAAAEPVVDAVVDEPEPAVKRVRTL